MNASAGTTEKISEVQMEILKVIKSQGGATNAVIAARLNVSYEAVRQQLRLLEAAEFVHAFQRAAPEGQAGRPTREYVLTAPAENLFPKAYDELVVELIDTLSSRLGADALKQVMASLTDDKVDQLAPHMEGKTLAEKLEALKGFYIEEDAFMEVAVNEDGHPLRLVERNCPFLNVAFRRPALCSITVSALSRLLGYAVTRERKFQEGHGRCVFLVHPDRQIDEANFRFAFEVQDAA